MKTFNLLFSILALFTVLTVQMGYIIQYPEEYVILSCISAAIWIGILTGKLEGEKEAWRE